jgi:transcription elongation GreA/GreB family factor
MDDKKQQNLTPDELRKEKIAMWSEKLKKLQEQFDDVRIRRGEAAREGDLRENAAYIDLTEQAEVLSARINDIQKMVEQLEQEGRNSANK